MQTNLKGMGDWWLPTRTVKWGEEREKSRQFWKDEWLTWSNFFFFYSKKYIKINLLWNSLHFYFSPYVYILLKSYLTFSGDTRWQCLCFDNGRLFQNIYLARRWKDRHCERSNTILITSWTNRNSMVDRLTLDLLCHFIGINCKYSLITHTVVRYNNFSSRC